MSEASPLPRTIELYSQECVDLLQQALKRSEAELHPRRTAATRESDSSSDDDDENDDNKESDSSESSLESDNEKEQESSLDTVQEQQEQPSGQNVPTPLQKEQSAATVKQPPPSKRASKKNRQKEVIIGTPPTVALPLADDKLALHVPSALLDKHDRHDNNMCTSLLTMATNMSLSKPVIVLLLKSGRFAGGVFLKKKCVAHRACQRYTVRRGQGKAQSSLDSSKRKANSMGAQLRRAGEVNLWQDVTETMGEWQAHVKQAALVLISCPKTMKKGLRQAVGSSWNDSIIRKIPLDVGRPTYESVCAVHEVMMQASLRENDLVENEHPPAEIQTTDADAVADNSLPPIREEVKETIVKEFPPMGPLHTLAAEGDLQALQDMLLSDNTTEQIDVRAGQDYMTALHYAAQSPDNDVDPVTGAAIVSLLLTKGGADPCVMDARHRVPYFLAAHEKVREAFRIARAELGEECWPWDGGAKVGPPLTQDDVLKKQEKAAEKKRRQRARQREKKAKEKAVAEEMAQRAKEEEEKCKQEEDAKRIRDGLAPKKSAATNVCDFCQTVCKGKRRSQMFQRLDYVYCSADCVQKHKRELMAKAAMSRLG